MCSVQSCYLQAVQQTLQAQEIRSHLCRPENQCRQLNTASQVLSPAHRARIVVQLHMNYPLWKTCVQLPVLNQYFQIKLLLYPPKITFQIRVRQILKKCSIHPLLQTKSICLSHLSWYWYSTITETHTGVPRVPGAPEGPAAPVSPC